MLIRQSFAHRIPLLSYHLLLYSVAIYHKAPKNSPRVTFIQRREKSYLIWHGELKPILHTFSHFITSDLVRTELAHKCHPIFG